MLRAIIIEDEKNNRETLKNLLAEFCPEVSVESMGGTVEEGLSLMRLLRPDLLFLDIELHTGTGFDLLAQLEGSSFDVIFTTAHERYAIKAIKFSSLDYLLKPIDPDELQAAVQKALKRKSAADQQARLDVLLSHLRPAGQSERRICLSTADGLEFVLASDILYCEANGSYTDFHLKNGQKIMVSKHLKEYENLLDDKDFMRVHHRFLVNLRQVRRFVKSEGGYILMNNGAQLGISPKKRVEFVERMEGLG